MKRIFHLFIFLVAAQAQTIRGVRKKDLQEYTGSTFTCRDRSKSISSSLVNDQFCDCEDGSDEPGTSACTNGQFWCKNKGFRGSFLPSSRINDGVCDCCDGSDENQGVCQDRCAELGKEVQKDVLKEIELIDAGVGVKRQWIEEAQALVASKEKELEQLREELKIKEQEVEAAKVVKEKEEEIERIERERIDAINAAAKAAREAAAAAAGTPASETHPPAETPATTTTDTEPSQPQQVEVEVPAFPYPEQYAFKPPVAEEKKDDAAFPYPKEYAAPPQQQDDTTTTENDIQEFLNDGEDDEGDDGTVHDTSGGEAAVPEEKPVEEGELEKYQSEGLFQTIKTFFRTHISEPFYAYMRWNLTAADKARKAYDEADSARREIQTKVLAHESWLKTDHGQEREFAHMHGQCYSINIRQYTYEVCPYDKAEQKEGGRGTSLGSWEGWKELSEVSDLGFKVDESAYNRVMKFHNGQGCWQGPSRSLTVLLKCGSSVEVAQVEEPNKCVYTAVLHTPAVCTPTHAQALRLNLEQNNLFEEE